MEQIWDLTPDGGGPPVQVTVGNPREAIRAHPQRYTRVAPDGTAQAEMAKRKAADSQKYAAINKELNDKLGEIAKARQDKLDAIAKEQADARIAALEKQRGLDKKAAEDSGVVPSRDGEIAAVKSEAAAAAEMAELEAAEKRRALDAGAPTPAPTVPRPQPRTAA